VSDVSELRLQPGRGLVFVSGRSTGSTSGSDYATVAYDASTGAKLWIKRYNGPENYSDAAYALGVSPDGSTVFVTGLSYDRSTDSPDYATVAYHASTGTKLWTRRYNGPPNSVDRANALAVSSDGSTVFVTGKSLGWKTELDYVTVAYESSTGAKLWTQRYKGHGNADDRAHALGVSPDGSTVFVTGESTGSTSSYDYATVAYDAGTGARLWMKRYNGRGIAKIIRMHWG
jgi:PQQ-like domain